MDARAIHGGTREDVIRELVTKSSFPLFCVKCMKGGLPRDHAKVEERWGAEENVWAEKTIVVKKKTDGECVAAHIFTAHELDGTKVYDDGSVYTFRSKKDKPAHRKKEFHLDLCVHCGRGIYNDTDALNFRYCSLYCKYWETFADQLLEDL